jgi:hypothetical protein
MTSSAKAAESSPRKSGLSRLADRLENARDRWQTDPVGWVETRLAGKLWSRQREVARLVVGHRRVTVRSGHATGKTRLAASLACWWIDTHPIGEAIVITTAPTFAQVSQVFWQELRRIHTAGALDGTITLDNRWTMPDGTLVALGRRPADWNPGALSGYHRRWVLVIIDEASGIPRWLWDAVETITTGDQCRILAVGNPDDTTSFFADVHRTEPGWRRVRIPCTDTPAFTNEPFPPHLTELLVTPNWVEDKKTRWGEDSPLYISKITGEFADSSENTLIPMSWIRQAQHRWTQWHDREDVRNGHREPYGPRTIGIDVGWSGTNADATAISILQGDILQRVDTHKGMDTGQVTSLAMAQLTSPRATAVVDSVGIGAGVLDQLRAAGANAKPFMGSWATHRRDNTNTWRFRNTRAASWWAMRELLDPAGGATLALPPDDDLAAELSMPRWAPATGGYIDVETKPELRKRLNRSPDRADSAVMACWFHRPTGTSTLDPWDIPEPLHPIPYSPGGRPWEGFTRPTGIRPGAWN